MSRLHVVQGRSVSGMRGSVGRDRRAGGVGVWPAVVGVRGLRSCGRAPAQSILHASWIQDVAECRMARSRPRSDMEASTISYLRAALSEFFGAGGEPEPASVTGTWTGHGRSHG